MPVPSETNHKDQELGRFWESRFRAVRLPDEAALVACAAYIDLNPIRAAMVESLGFCLQRAYSRLTPLE